MAQIRNLKMALCYEGTNYAGFQRQRVGLVTIQGTIEDSLYLITGEAITINGAGRTDAGVHAHGQVISFNSHTYLSCDQLLKAVNSVLPRDMLIKTVSEVGPEFHARFSALAKTYSYRIYNSPLRPVFERQFVYHHRHPLNLEPMQDACASLIGRYDFRAFQAAGSSVRTTVRSISTCQLTRYGPEIRLVINADGFLYHMVRNIVGTLILVGNGRLSVVGFKDIIASRDRSRAGETAPALGLCLEEVSYPE